MPRELAFIPRADLAAIKVAHYGQNGRSTMTSTHSRGGGGHVDGCKAFSGAFPKSAVFSALCRNTADNGVASASAAAAGNDNLHHKQAAVLLNC
jgi:hypothetical protein